MNIKEKTLSTLEFDKIRAMLAAVCPTKGAAEAAFSLVPDDRIEIIIRKQRRTTDGRRLLDAGLAAQKRVDGLPESFHPRGAAAYRHCRRAVAQRLGCHPGKHPRGHLLRRYGRVCAPDREADRGKGPA